MFQIKVYARNIIWFYDSYIYKICKKLENEIIVKDDGKYI